MNAPTKYSTIPAMALFPPVDKLQEASPFNSFTNVLFLHAFEFKNNRFNPWKIDAKNKPGLMISFALSGSVNVADKDMIRKNIPNINANAPNARALFHEASISVLSG